MLAVDDAIYAKLAAGTALTTLLGGTAIYNALAPRGSAITYPLVIFSKSSGLDDNTSPCRTRTLVYQVTALSATGKKEAEDIDTVIDTVLHNTTLSVTGWSDYWFMRENDISYVEQIPGGRILWHEGAMYRVRIQD